MLLSTRTRLAFLAMAFQVFATITASHTAANTLRTVALTGAPVPGAAPDARFTGFERRISIALNNAGQTAFQTFFTEAGLNQAGLLTEGGGAGLRVSARVTVPKVDGAPLLHVLQSLNDQGQTAYFAKVPPNLAAGQPLDLFRDNGPGDSEVVARWSSPVESTGFAFTELFPYKVPLAGNGVSLTDDGRVVFPARATDSGAAGDRYLGVWREGPTGEFDRVVRVGDAAPGTAGDFLLLGTPPYIVANRSGRFAFPGVATDGARGIWSEHPDGLKLDVRAGDLAPGAGGATISGFASTPDLAFNGQNHLSFEATLTGPGITGTNNTGLWSIRSSGLELMARKGDQAPGAAVGQTFSTFYANALNARGDRAFIAATGGPGGSSELGVWSDAGGQGFQAVAYPGIPAPGVGTNVVFDSITFGFISSSFATPLVLNAHGQVAFHGSIVGPGVDDSNRSGIWAQDRTGILRLIARTGQQINVSGDPLQPDWRTISSLLVNGSSGNDDGRRSWFNDQGQLAYFARFTDGSEGLFVSDGATVPEPNTLALLLLFPFFRPPRAKT